MTPEGALRLIELYARAQSELEADRVEAAEPLIASAEALLVEAPPPDADRQLLRVLALQAEDARSAAVTALNAARDRLLRAAQAELRPGGGPAGAYAGSHERPGARFFDRTG